MFERWPNVFSPPTRRILDPPMSVMIDLARLIDNTSDSPFRAEAVPIRVKSEGLDLNGRVPGELHAWARTTSLHLASRSTGWGRRCSPLKGRMQRGDRRGSERTHEWRAFR